MDDLARLSAWVVDAGGHHDGLAVRELDGLRGIVATRAIAAGAELARIPRRLIVTLEAALDSPVGRQLRDAGLQLSTYHMRLAAWLLVERRDPRSIYHPYFDTLPRALPRFPLYAAPADRALLEGSLAGDMLDELRARLDADHAALTTGVPLCAPIARDELMWARLCVGSRCFSAMIDGAATSVLVPFVDMLNHQRGPGTRWAYDRAGEAFTLTALRAYQPDDAVCCDYGAKPNLRLLLHYGFCLDDNDADEALLGFADPVRVIRDPHEPLAQVMLAQLRGQYRSEAAARATLAQAARASLARFATTVAEDDALLARSELSADARNFITVRRGEKRVLQAWLDLATDGPAELFHAPAS